MGNSVKYSNIFYIDGTKLVTKDKEKLNTDIYIGNWKISETENGHLQFNRIGNQSNFYLSLVTSFVPSI